MRKYYLFRMALSSSASLLFFTCMLLAPIFLLTLIGCGGENSLNSKNINANVSVCGTKDEPVCKTHQKKDALCRCAESCEDGYVYESSTKDCRKINSCRSELECQSNASGKKCIDITAPETDCTKSENCTCETMCNPLAIESGCANDLGCLMIDDQTAGVCHNPDGRAKPGDACEAELISDYNLSDTCSQTTASVCIGSNKDSAAGKCARLCIVGQNDLCQNLGQSKCVSNTMTSGDIGICALQAIGVGASCNNKTDCNPSSYCDADYGCTQDCTADEGICPVDTACVKKDGLGRKICARRCDLNNDTCASTNSGTSCDTFNQDGTTITICRP